MAAAFGQSPPDDIDRWAQARALRRLSWPARPWDDLRWECVHCGYSWYEPWPYMRDRGHPTPEDCGLAPCMCEYCAAALQAARFRAAVLELRPAAVFVSRDWDGAEPVAAAAEGGAGAPAGERPPHFVVLAAGDPAPLAPRGLATPVWLLPRHSWQGIRALASNLLGCAGALSVPGLDSRCAVHHEFVRLVPLVAERVRVEAGGFVVEGDGLPGGMPVRAKCLAGHARDRHSLTCAACAATAEQMQAAVALNAEAQQLSPVSAEWAQPAVEPTPWVQLFCHGCSNNISMLARDIAAGVLCHLCSDLHPDPLVAQALTALEYERTFAPIGPVSDMFSETSFVCARAGHQFVASLDEVPHTCPACAAADIIRLPALAVPGSRLTVYKCPCGQELVGSPRSLARRNYACRNATCPESVARAARASDDGGWGDADAWGEDVTADEWGDSASDEPSD